MIRRLLVALACMLAGLAGPAWAKVDTSADFRLIRAGEPIQLRVDRAYILLRIDTSLSHFSADLLRVPDQEEIGAYEAAKRAAHDKVGAKAPPIDAFVFDYKGRPDLYELPSGKWLAQNGKIATVLAEVTPGDYVFYGEGYGGFLYECMCLGTVGFSAPAGQVTDLGTMLIAYAARPSPIPELAGEVDLGPSAMMDYALFAVALRPQHNGEGIPDGIDAAKVMPARLHAIGTFVEPYSQLINRLAPIPGVLAYDAGRVIDVATGREAPGN